MLLSLGSGVNNLFVISNIEVQGSATNTTGKGFSNVIRKRGNSRVMNHDAI